MTWIFMCILIAWVYTEARSNIVMCRSDRSSKNVELGHTTADQRYFSLPTYARLRNTAFSVNNITTCSFDRIIKPGRVKTNNVGSLTKPFYLLRAWGPVTNGTPVQHISRGSSVVAFSAAGHSVLSATTTIGGCLVMTVLILLLP
ncbi:uncharacterized protein [Argopecten irradians]|uniref:uncharacterized protein n=1 Tax=Argopecten irradians TaxID=31199 RepID=UPI00371BB731